MTLTKDAQFWDRTSAKYAKSPIGDQPGYQRTLDRTRDYLSSGDRVLELGCGTGTTALHLAVSVRSYLATDISPEMIGIAKMKLSEATVAGLRFETATAESVPGTDLFNTVLGFSYLHLVRDLPGTLRRIHELLVPGGFFISKTPCVGDMSFLIKLAIPVMRAVGKAPYAGVFKATELKEAIELAGFEVIAVETHGTKGNVVRPFIVARRK